MNEKANRKTRHEPFSSLLQSAGSTPAITMESRSATHPKRITLIVEHGLAYLRNAWTWVQRRSKVQRRAQKLRVCESAQLGDKKFIALIQADGQRFLIGGTSSSISLLATLPSRKNSRGQSQKTIPFEVRES